MSSEDDAHVYHGCKIISRPLNTGVLYEAATTHASAVCFWSTCECFMAGRRKGVAFLHLKALSDPLLRYASAIISSRWSSRDDSITRSNRVFGSLTYGLHLLRLVRAFRNIRTPYRNRDIHPRCVRPTSAQAPGCSFVATCTQSHRRRASVRLHHHLPSVADGAKSTARLHRVTDIGDILRTDTTNSGDYKITWQCAMESRR